MEPYRVMIVDDERLVRASIRNRTNWAGMQTEVVCEASGGEEALRNMQLFHPEILLVDICMPDMNGFELVNRARQIVEDLRVIIISGYSDYRYLRSGVQLKVEDYLCKPIDVEELENSIRKITGAPARQEPEAHAPSFRTDNMIDRICDYVRRHYSEPLTLSGISCEFFLSPVYLSTYFKQHKKINLFEYIRDIRIENAKLLLMNTNQSITDVAQAVGFSDAAYFQRVFKGIMKQTPREYRYHVRKPEHAPAPQHAQAETR